MYIPRLFFGSIVLFVTHILNGFYLYDNLTPDEKDEGQDIRFLYVLRIIIMTLLCTFTAYLLLALICLITVGSNKANHHIFKRIPFGTLMFDSGINCPICLVKFNTSDKVV